jgi:hypothetical protein
MSQTISAFDFTEQQRAGAALFGNAVFNHCVEAMLAAQASLFVNGEAVLMAWMNRRHEAILDAQRLLARMRECRDFSDAIQAQQEWMSGALKRLTDDAAGYQHAMQVLVSAATPDEEQGARAKPEELLRQAANDGKPAATAPRAASVKAAGER